MNKLIQLLMLAVIVSIFAGCVSAPSDNSSAQRSRAGKAQSELGAEVSK